MTTYRTEKDALGTIDVPQNARHGIYTQRVINNYKVSQTTVPTMFLQTYIKVKLAYAQANHKVGKLKKPLRDAIVKACKDLLALSDEELQKIGPVDQVQSGGGTSTNMLVNELIANTAAQNLGKKLGKYDIIDPHDHVNMSQSSNDTFPGTIKLMCLVMIPQLLKQLSNIEGQLEKISSKYSKTAKVGRTHLQDAIMMTVGNEFSAFSRTINKNKKYLTDTVNVLLESNFGGTAIGTKQNIDSKLRGVIIDQLKITFKLPVKRSRNYFEQNSSSGDLMYLSQTLNHLATDMIKICNDLRLLSSGPHAGIGELKLPEVQPGSSIMPGKVNPSILEAFTQICAKVMGNHKTIEVLTMQAQLQLQQFNPGIAWALHESLLLLEKGTAMLTNKCIKGIKADERRIKSLVDNSFAFATEYAEKLGYDVVAEAVIQATKKGCCLREILD